MATRFYTFQVFNAGAPVTGAAGSFTVLQFKRLSNGANQTPVPTIIEYGSGVYGFGVDPETIGDDSQVLIDISATYGSGATRYLNFVCKLNDTRGAFALAATTANLPANQPVEVGSYATGMSPAAQVLATGAAPIQTNPTTGAVEVDMAQAVPFVNAGNTHGDCLNAARAQGFGAWVINGTTLTLYASDGLTVVRSFTLNSATSPTARS